jgi:hypothetical protein
VTSLVAPEPAAAQAFRGLARRLHFGVDD